jgi:hypothetical protein
MSHVPARFRLAARHGESVLLELPWDLPLAEWHDDRMVRMAHGISRHIVRFVEFGGVVFALKETHQGPAEREYGLLRELADRGLPVVEAVGVASLGDRAVLITRYLDFAFPYRYLFGARGGPDRTEHLVDALVVLLVRLHLAGFFWGDCSLSNTLFRRDAGALAAYLVDAETGDLVPSLTVGQREHDLSIAAENIGGELLDLREAGRLPDEVDPTDVAAAVDARYRNLWRELTDEEVVPHGDRFVLDQRIRRLNQLGFDVEELEVVATGDGHELRIRPQLVEEGHHRRRLRRLVGLDVQENQARRLLNDLDAYRAWMERSRGGTVPEAVAAARWLSDVFEPAVEAVPLALRGRLDPAELFHEILEHRWFLSEQAGHEVSTEQTVASYLESVLAGAPEERLLLDE